MKRKPLYIVALAMLMASLVACGTSGSENQGSANAGSGGAGSSGAGSAGDGPRGTLRFGSSQVLRDWEPLTAVNSIYTSLVYEGLVNRESDGTTIVPELATEWTEKPLEIDFTLRSGVVFHDGTPFNADAAVQNLERMKADPGDLQKVLASVKEFVAVDPTHVKIVLSEPSPNILINLARRNAMMVSPKALADGSFATNPVGTGPWRYNAQDSVEGSRVVVDYFDQYYAPETVGPRRIEVTYINDPNSLLNALRTGQQDIVWASASTAQQAEALGLATSNFSSVIWSLNLWDTEKTFADVNVRRAICSAIDPQQWADAMLGGKSEILTQHVLPGLPGYNEDVKGYTPDVEKAKSLMAEAGNPQVSFTLASYDSQRAITDLFQNEMSQIGVDVKVSAPTFSQFITTYLNGTFPATILSDGPPTGAYDWYLYHYVPDGAGNPYGISYPEIDAIAEKALAAKTPEEANTEWAKMTQYVHDQALQCGYFSYTGFWAYDKDKVDNIVSTTGDVAVFRYKEARPQGDG